MNGLFTVVIAEKELLDSIREYQVFLKPFIDNAHVGFCEWKPEEKTMSESAPRLAETVAHRKEWRAVILCGEKELAYKNPFDLAEYVPPAEDANQSRENYLEQLREAKFQAFERASQQPLTRLATFLCAGPLVTKNKNSQAARHMNPAELLDYAEYQAESQRKKEIRERITGGERPGFALPAQVLCVARRTCAAQDYDIRTSWTTHEDIQYSRFYDWNLYFDKMRYLVFDIVPRTSQDYEFDYIRFLCAVMLLANNKMPADALRPNRVFRLECENDEAALTQIMSLYDTKLERTGEVLSGKIHELESAEKERLSDRDARMIFCSNINVPVTFSREVRREGLYSDPKTVGLTTDHPADERDGWIQTYQNSRKTLRQILKQPRRALKSAAVDMRRLNHVNLDQAGRLNEFQAEDVREHTGEEELKMVSVDITDLFHADRYEKQMADHDRKIRRKIETRMTRKTTVAIILTALLLYLAGFLPLLVGGSLNRETVRWALIIMGGVGLALALVSFICLLFLRGSLRKLYRAFNSLMHGISEEIDGSLALFSRYLSHACNVMRGFSVLNYLEEADDPDTAQARVLKKHMTDIRHIREGLREAFGPYVSPTADIGSAKVEAYPYDFSRAVDFPYPIPYSDEMKCQIEFMQPGNTVEVPVRFMKRITIRREELYD